MIETMRIQLLRAGAAAPARATGGSVGYDLTACIDAPLTVSPGRTTFVPTGVAIELPQGCAGLVCARSGLSSKFGVAPINAVGVIDCDYRGELSVPLTAHYDSYTIQPGERVAQLLIVPVETPVLLPAQTLSETERGAGGFGSTGRA